MHFFVSYIKYININFNFHATIWFYDVCRIFRAQNAYFYTITLYLRNIVHCVVLVNIKYFVFNVINININRTISLYKEQRTCFEYNDYETNYGLKYT